MQHQSRGRNSFRSPAGINLSSNRADQLSGGESQRVAIARALMQRPRFMMADAPAASLDPKVGREVTALIVKLTRRENITLLFVSQDLQHALNSTDRLVGLNHGRLVLDEATRSLVRNFYSRRPANGNATITMIRVN